MANRTRSSERLDRSELADRLHALADEFEHEDGDVDVLVGNKRVTLAPGDRIDYEIEVTERASRLRKSREAIDIELRWKSG